MSYAFSMTLAAIIAATTLAAPALEVGMKVPDVVLTDMKGNSVSISQFVGKKLIVFNWASW